MNASRTIAQLGTTTRRLLDATRTSLQQAWRQLPTHEKIALAVGGLVAAALLAALVAACQESVRRGERLQAEWQLAAAEALRR